MAKETAFKGKDYSKSPFGDESNVKKLAPAETKSYYMSILTRSRILIVVVAELDRSVIEKKVKDLTADIPEGNKVMLNRFNYSPSKNTFTEQKKSVATNYIQGITSGPQPGYSDFNAFVIAMRYFF